MNGLFIVVWSYKKPMATEQYHEPAAELKDETRTFARMITSLIEEAEAINWYEQRISVEKDKWRVTLQSILFQKGDIVKLGEKGEEKAE